MINRRRFLSRSSVVSAVSLAGFPHIGRSAEQLAALTGTKPRHIIHLVADGTSSGTLTCGDHFSRLTRGRGLTWLELYKNPAAYPAYMNMRSLNSMVTDSAAAASSWGSGSRIINGAVNQSPTGQSLKTIYELLADKGWRRGLVTTTEITHATPAGFAANADDRDTGTLIASQYLDRQVDVLLGGGQKFFEAKQRRDKRDLIGDFARAGYRVMQTRAELEAAPLTQRWLGLFAQSHLPYMIDWKQDAKAQAAVPTLAQMTRSALKWLGRAPHFMLQVEGGRVDHACHNCDGASAMHEMIAFDEAIDACIEFRRQVPDTLIVITTDHGTANLGLNGMGSAYGQSSWLFNNTSLVTASFTEIMKRMKRKPSEILNDADAGGFNAVSEEVDEDGKATPRRADDRKTIIATPPEIVRIIQTATGYRMSERRAGLFAPFLNKKGSAAYDMMNGELPQLGQLMANWLGMSFTGTAHTADYVPLLALGPGAERFRGFIENVDVFQHYTQLAGITFKNPQEPLIAQASPDAQNVERVDEYTLV